MKEIQIAEGIFLYKNALSEQLCNDMWSFFYTHVDKTEQGSTSGGFMPSTKNTLDFDRDSVSFSDSEREQYLNFDKLIYESLRPATAEYIKRLDTVQKCPNLRDTGYLWQMYRKGEGFYREHVDGDQWSPAVLDRVLAVVIYINTVEQGGETYFRFQDVNVKPEQGAVCIFPAHWMYPHQAMVPMSSDKLIISSFINSINTFT